MAEEWPGESELVEALTDLATHRPISASRVRIAANIAMDNIREYKMVVYTIERFVRKSPPEYRLPGLYVIDAVCRQSKTKLGDRDVFTPRFSLRLSETLVALKCVPKADRQKLNNVVKEWQRRSMFPSAAPIDFDEVDRRENSLGGTGGSPSADSPSPATAVVQDPRMRRKSTGKQQPSSQPSPSPTPSLSQSTPSAPAIHLSQHGPQPSAISTLPPPPPPQVLVTSHPQPQSQMQVQVQPTLPQVQLPVQSPTTLLPPGPPPGAPPSMINMPNQIQPAQANMGSYGQPSQNINISNQIQPAQGNLGAYSQPVHNGVMPNHMALGQMGVPPKQDAEIKFQSLMSVLQKAVQEKNEKTTVPMMISGQGQQPLIGSSQGTQLNTNIQAQTGQQMNTSIQSGSPMLIHQIPQQAYQGAPPPPPPPLQPGLSGPGMSGPPLQSAPWDVAQVPPQQSPGISGPVGAGYKDPRQRAMLERQQQEEARRRAEQEAQEQARQQQESMIRAEDAIQLEQFQEEESHISIDSIISQAQEQFTSTNNADLQLQNQPGPMVGLSIPGPPLSPTLQQQAPVHIQEGSSLPQPMQPAQIPGPPPMPPANSVMPPPPAKMFGPGPDGPFPASAFPPRPPAGVPPPPPLNGPAPPPSWPPRGAPPVSPVSPAQSLSPTGSLGPPRGPPPPGPPPLASQDSGSSQPDSFPLNRKTKKCKRLELAGLCRYGSNCNFAHSDEELTQGLSALANLNQAQRESLTKACKDNVGGGNASTENTSSATQASGSGSDVTVLFSSPKSRLCKSVFLRVPCKWGDNCNFSHSEEEIQALHPDLSLEEIRVRCQEETPPWMVLKKTRICRYFLDGKCPFQDRCTFAHGEHELSRLSQYEPLFPPKPLGLGPPFPPGMGPLGPGPLPRGPLPPGVIPPPPTTPRPLALNSNIKPLAGGKVTVIEEFGGHLPLYELERRIEAMAEAALNPDNPANIEEISVALDTLSRRMTSEETFFEISLPDEDEESSDADLHIEDDHHGETAGKKRRKPPLVLKPKKCKRTFYSNPYLLDFFHGSDQYQYNSAQTTGTHYSSSDGNPENETGDAETRENNVELGLHTPTPITATG